MRQTIMGKGQGAVGTGDRAMFGEEGWVRWSADAIDDPDLVASAHHLGNLSGDLVTDSDWGDILRAIVLWPYGSQSNGYCHKHINVFLSYILCQDIKCHRL